MFQSPDTWTHLPQIFLWVNLYKARKNHGGCSRNVPCFQVIFMFKNYWLDKEGEKFSWEKYQWSWTMQPKHVGAFQVTSSMTSPQDKQLACLPESRRKQGNAQSLLSKGGRTTRRAVILSDSNYHILQPECRVALPTDSPSRSQPEEKLGGSFGNHLPFHSWSSRRPSCKIEGPSEFSASVFRWLGLFACFFVLLEVPMSSDPWGIPVTQMLLAPRLGPFLPHQNTVVELIGGPWHSHWESSELEWTSLGSILTLLLLLSSWQVIANLFCLLDLFISWSLLIY